MYSVIFKLDSGCSPGGGHWTVGAESAVWPDIKPRKIAETINFIAENALFCARMRPPFIDGPLRHKPRHLHALSVNRAAIDSARTIWISQRQAWHPAIPYRSMDWDECLTYSHFDCW